MHRALVYTRTAQYRHDSIPAGVAVIDELGRHLGLAIDATEEPGAFTPQQLADCRVVVFLSTSGDVLTEKAFVVNGELIEADADKFIHDRLAANGEITPCKQ